MASIIPYSDPLPAKLHPLLLPGDGDLVALVSVERSVGVREMDVTLCLLVNWGAEFEW